ncbi:MAG: hypothetical protein KH369_16040 [Paraclostridium bifermentans]|uniref:hypothetical protein n=1 Tax=Paraclostridium bifermentans TaxID=1490 RepID=UPI001DE5FEB5|nr:hypothetical protein [Paraclostridium bifermentans]MBS6509713.1 hypothetical protein [Paraclostridium bifermentans]
MLNTSKSITISGHSIIQDQVVAYMSANLSTDGNTNESLSKNIQNQSLYDSNKEAVRKDMRDFEDLVYEEQDKLVKTINTTKEGN